MAIKSSDQISIVDVTDAYNVILTSEAYTFPGSTSAAKAGSCTTQVLAYQGTNQIACSVVNSEITKPTGITTSVNTDATAPTITITASTSFASAGEVVIPVHIGSDIVIQKKMSLAIAFTGQPGSNGSSAQWYSGTGITGTSTTATAFSNSGVASANVGDMYINTSTQNIYRCTVAGAPSAAKWVYVSNIKGATGGQGPAGSSAQWYSGTGITGTSTTATVFSGSGVSSANVGDMYVNTSTQNLYRCTVAGAASAAKWIYVCNIKGATGGTGPAGADAITMSVISSNGTIFKNTAIATTLTAHVYVAGAEVTGTALSNLGTIKWYKDGGSTAVATGQTLTIDSGDVTSKATYVAQLEG